MMVERAVYVESPGNPVDQGRYPGRDFGLLAAELRGLAECTRSDYQNLFTIIAEHIEGVLAGLPVDALLARLRAEARREADQRENTDQRLRRLGEVSREFAASTGELGQLLDLVARSIGELLGDLCGIRATSSDGQWIEASGAVYHRDPALAAAAREAMELSRQRVGEGITGRVAASGHAILIRHLNLPELRAASEPQYARLLERLDASSAIMLPLRYRGDVVGVANLLRGQGSPPYDDRDLAFAESLADHAAFAIANARAHEAERAARMAAGLATVAREQAETRFARLSESGVLGIVVADLDGRILEINDALLRTLGHSRDDILSGRVVWREMTPPEWRDVDTRALANLLESGIGGLREKEVLRKDGTRAFVMINTVMLEGSSRECISYVLDLTARREAELAVAQLREQRALDARIRELLESAPDAMVVADEAGAIVLVNRQAETLFGYARSEMIGQRVELLLPSPLGAAYRGHRAAYFRDPGLRTMGDDLELRGRRKDGNEFPIEVSLSPLQTDAGLLVSSAIRDITERKRADQQRASLAAIVDASADAIIGKTPAGEITSWNRGAERIFGYLAQEVIGKSIVLLIPPERSDEEQEILRTLAAGETLHFDTVRRRKDGTDIDVSVTASPVWDSAGRVVAIAKVARDITERRQIEAALVRAKDAAEAAGRELEAFSYSVAHDLRAPLRGMNGFAQILLDDYRDKLDAEGVDCLQEIHANAKNMGELIDALLSLSRTTRTDLTPARVDLTALVRSSAADLAAKDPERTVHVVIEERVVVRMDPVLTRVLFDNLLGNAWKFTAKVSSAHIEVGTTRRDGMRAVFVRDNGAGFEMAHAHKLFAPFQRLHTVAEFAGTGIGLATVQRIAQRHRARVWAEGKVDAGATFYLGLPASCWGSP